MSIEKDLLPHLQSAFPSLEKSSLERVCAFAQALYRENERQNLTRIEGSRDFVDGHCRDVVEILRYVELGRRVCDVGSGSGVPGLLAACMDPDSSREWHLVESEAHKAGFLSDAAAAIGLSNVFVYPGRAEVVVKEIGPDTVIARAVGPVERIAAWIWNCSTWNKLVLFKSRGWREEWESAKKNKFGKKLTVIHEHEYSIGEKYRVIVSLTRS